VSVVGNRAVSAALVLAALASAGTASAQEAAAERPIVDPAGPESSGIRGDLPETTWREGAQDRLRTKYDANFTFEFRFGPYWPEIDSEFGDNGPYERVFDNDAQFYFGIGLDWTPIRIPYVGRIGPGIGWGITPAEGKAINPATGRPSDVDTSLTIMPMNVSAVLRVDELLRKTKVPLAPYGKLGFGFATWSSSTANGTSEGACDPSDPRRVCEAEDTTLGLHLALGVALTLDWVDQQRANNIQEMGVGHLYLFGEWMHAALDGLGSRPQLQVGTSTFVGGVAIDF
jgi:hypothetical protein